MADVGPIKVPDGLTDEQVLFLSDIFPTGYMARSSATSKRRDDRGLGLRSGRSIFHSQRFLLGAARVIAIDTVPERLAAGRVRPEPRR